MLSKRGGARGAPAACAQLANPRSRERAEKFVKNVEEHERERNTKMLAANRRALLVGYLIVPAIREIVPAIREIVTAIREIAPQLRA